MAKCSVCGQTEGTAVHSCGGSYTVNFPREAQPFFYPDSPFQYVTRLEPTLTEADVRRIMREELANRDVSDRHLAAGANQ